MWVGFLHTVVSKLLSGPGEIEVSRNGIDPSVFGVSFIKTSYILLHVCLNNSIFFWNSVFLQFPYFQNFCIF